MLDTWNPLPLDTSLSAQVIRHPSASPLQVISKVALDGIDLSAYVESFTQTATDASIRLRWHQELYVPTMQPLVDEVVELLLNGQQLWIGIVQSITDYGESRGERRMTLVARSRDTSPLWRASHVTTSSYSMTTDLAVIIREVLAFLHLTTTEISVPDSLGVYTVHTSTQMADMSPWEMLSVMLQPAGYEPYVDALGRFKLISRSFNRSPDIVLSADRILSVGAGKSTSPTTKVRVKWLDPNLTKTNNADQKLADATITAGFFQMVQEQDVYFSNDSAQRAENTRLVIKQSCNSGLLEVADEDYAQTALTEGRITLTTKPWVAAAALGAMYIMVKTGEVGDIVPFSGMTITVGRRLHAAAEMALMLIMMSIGTGVYEIWGTPYDYVHAVNTTIAFNQDAPEWAEVIEEISNDFVMNEAMAQSLAVRELVYLSLAASQGSLVLVDDPRIERGDILELADGSRFYVTGYRREVGRGKPHTLSVDGFRV